MALLERFCAREGGLRAELAAVLSALDEVRRIKKTHREADGAGGGGDGADGDEGLAGVVTDIFNMRDDLDFSSADDIRLSATCHKARTPPAPPARLPVMICVLQPGRSGSAQPSAARF